MHFFCLKFSKKWFAVSLNLEILFSSFQPFPFGPLWCFTLHVRDGWLQWSYLYDAPHQSHLSHFTGRFCTLTDVQISDKLSVMVLYICVCVSLLVQKSHEGLICVCQTISTVIPQSSSVLIVLVQGHCY